MGEFAHLAHIHVCSVGLVAATRRGSIKLAARETLNRVMHLQKVATSKTCTCMIFTLFDLQPMRLLQQGYQIEYGLLSDTDTQTSIKYEPSKGLVSKS